MNIMPKQFGKLFEEESLLLKKTVSNIDREHPKDTCKKESSKKLNIKKKDESNVEEDVTGISQI